MTDCAHHSIAPMWPFHKGHRRTVFTLAALLWVPWGAGLAQARIYGAAPPATPLKWNALNAAELTVSLRNSGTTPVRVRLRGIVSGLTSDAGETIMELPAGEVQRFQFPIRVDLRGQTGTVPAQKTLTLVLKDEATGTEAPRQDVTLTISGTAVSTAVGVSGVTGAAAAAGTLRYDRDLALTRVSLNREFQVHGIVTNTGIEPYRYSAIVAVSLARGTPESGLQRLGNEAAGLTSRIPPGTAPGASRNSDDVLLRSLFFPPGTPGVGLSLSTGIWYTATLHIVSQWDQNPQNNGLHYVFRVGTRGEIIDTRTVPIATTVQVR